MRTTSYFFEKMTFRAFTTHETLLENVHFNEFYMNSLHFLNKKHFWDVSEHLYQKTEKISKRRNFFSESFFPTIIFPEIFSRYFFLGIKFEEKNSKKKSVGKSKSDKKNLKKSLKKNKIPKKNMWKVEKKYNRRQDFFCRARHSGGFNNVSAQQFSASKLISKRLNSVF